MMRFRDEKIHGLMNKLLFAFFILNAVRILRYFLVDLFEGKLKLLNSKNIMHLKSGSLILTIHILFYINMITLKLTLDIIPSCIKYH